MKSFFDIVLLLFVTLTMFICMMFFAEELTIQQEAIHLRNRVIEIMEINNGYTNEAKNEINKIIEKSGRNIKVNVNKEGTLRQGEEVIFDIVITYERRLPFDESGKEIEYKIMGEYYNINS